MTSPDGMPPDKSNMSRYLFGGFSRCLYPTQKFQSDAERKLAVVLEREWTCPAFVESVFDFTLPALRTEAG
jgi:hypothetical protein